jgi:hypothetical protein
MKFVSRLTSAACHAAFRRRLGAKPYRGVIIAPWYSLFNVATRGDVKTIQEQVLTPTMNPARVICQPNAGGAIHQLSWSATLQLLFQI